MGRLTAPPAPPPAAPFTIELTLEDGRTVSAPWDPDPAHLTGEEWREIGGLDPALIGVDVTDEQAAAAGVVYMNLRREIPDTEWETFAPFMGRLFAGDPETVAIEGGDHGA